MAGSANNQLADDRQGEALRRRAILYAPDDVINAGGLISVAIGLAGEDPQGDQAWARISLVAAALAEIFAGADAEEVAPNVVADRLAAERNGRHRPPAAPAR